MSGVRIRKCASVSADLARSGKLNRPRTFDNSSSCSTSASMMRTDLKPIHNMAAMLPCAASGKRSCPWKVFEARNLQKKRSITYASLETSPSFYIELGRGRVWWAYLTSYIINLRHVQFSSGFILGTNKGGQTACRIQTGLRSSRRPLRRQAAPRQHNPLSCIQVPDGQVETIC